MNRFYTGWLIVVFLGLTNLQAAEFQPRIIGGDDAAEGEWPATVGLLFTDTYNARLTAGDTVGIAQFQAQFCAGALIAPDWVLTAAHCVHDINNNRLSTADIFVLAAVTDLRDDGQQLMIRNIIVHPNYNVATFDSDIALLKLETASVPPAEEIGLYQGDPAVGSDATVVGWGDTTNSLGDFPFILQEVVLQVVSNTDCNAASAYNGGITDNMICAAAPGKDSCGADSGGPLMALQNGTFLQLGIVSFGNQCALPDFPGVYTRVARFDSWISDTMAGVIPDEGGSGGSFGWFLFPIGLLMLMLRLIRYPLSDNR